MRTPYTDQVGERLLCCVPGCERVGGWRRGTVSDPHHVRTKGAIGQKDEGNVVPLCLWHHDEGHRIGWRTWTARHGVCLPAVALFVLSWIRGDGAHPSLRVAGALSGDMDW
jgi:hypothetical protein